MRLRCHSKATNRVPVATRTPTVGWPLSACSGLHCYLSAYNWPLPLAQTPAASPRSWLCAHHQLCPILLTALTPSCWIWGYCWRAPRTFAPAALTGCQSCGCQQPDPKRYHISVNQEPPKAPHAPAGLGFQGVLACPHPQVKVFSHQSPSGRADRVFEYAGTHAGLHNRVQTCHPTAAGVHNLLECTQNIFTQVSANFRRLKAFQAWFPTMMCD